MDIDKYFKSQELIHPLSAPNSVDLSRYLARRSGINLWNTTEHEVFFNTYLSDKDTDRAVFILIDGLGMNTRHFWPENGFLQRNFRTEYLAVYPSTTVCALSALSAAEHTCQLGLSGWDTCLPEQNLILTVLPMQNRETKKFLADSQLQINQVIQKKSIRDQFPRGSSIISPGVHTGSQYSRWTAGKARKRGYQTLKEAFSLTALEAISPGITYTYLPQIDHEEHVSGPDSDNVRDLIEQIDEQLQVLRDKTPGDIPLIITADHGQITIHEEDQIWLSKDHKIMEFLTFPPSGEAVNTVFFVIKEKRNDFVLWFNENYGEDFLLIKSEQIFEQNLMGPEEPNPITTQRFGDFTAIATGKKALRYCNDLNQKARITGFHGGLRPDEMKIPLVIA